MFDLDQDLFFDIKEIIEEEWNPQKYFNETDYHKDLYQLLKNRLREDRRIFRERGNNRADIVIDDKIGIEIKKDLRHKSEVDRCVTQVKRMKREYNYIFSFNCWG